MCDDSDGGSDDFQPQDDINDEDNNFEEDDSIRHYKKDDKFRKPQAMKVDRKSTF